MQVEFDLTVHVTMNVIKQQFTDFDDTVTDILMYAEQHPEQFLNGINPDCGNTYFLAGFKANEIEDYNIVPAEPEIPDYEYMGA